jgi:Co/Zn/Cd efflux system component
MDKGKNGQETELEKGLLPPNKLKNKEVRSQKIKLGIMISMTFLVFLVELFCGYFSDSIALIADAFHM